MLRIRRKSDERFFDKKKDLVGFSAQGQTKTATFGVSFYPNHHAAFLLSSGVFQIEPLQLTGEPTYRPADTAIHTKSRTLSQRLLYVYGTLTSHIPLFFTSLYTLLTGKSPLLTRIPTT
jgi:hypothetical protein